MYITTRFINYLTAYRITNNYILSHRSMNFTKLANHYAVLNILLTVTPSQSSPEARVRVRVKLANHYAVLNILLTVTPSQSSPEARVRVRVKLANHYAVLNILLTVTPSQSSPEARV